MKLNEANIFGFGKLEDFKINFGKKITIIYGDNEIGKSTLQTFIWAMLYGLVDSESNSRKKLMEFSKYSPWNEKSSYKGIIKYSLDSEQAIEIHRQFEPHRIEILDGLKGSDITGTFEMQKNKEPRFAFEHLGLTSKEFINTAFFKQRYTHEFDEDDRTNISARLISFAQTGDEEHSVKKAIEKLNDAIRIKIGVEDSRAIKPLRIAIEQKEDILNKLKIALQNHELILNLSKQLKDDAIKLKTSENNLLKIKQQTEKKEYINLKEKIDAVLNYQKISNNLELEIQSLAIYAYFPANELKRANELNTTNNNIKLDLDKFKERQKQLYLKKETLEANSNANVNIEDFNKDNDKLIETESKKDTLDYSLTKEIKNLSDLKEKLIEIENNIYEFKQKSGELNENLIEKLQFKDLMENNLLLKEKEIGKLKEELSIEDQRIFKQRKTIKIKKMFAIIFCLFLIGIPFLLYFKKIEKKLELDENILNQNRKYLLELEEKFDIENENYRKLHKIQLLIQEQLQVTNFLELRSKFEEFDKSKDYKIQLDEKVNDIKGRMLEFINLSENLDKQINSLIIKYGVESAKFFKEKHRICIELNKEITKINQELKIIFLTVEEKEKQLTNNQKTLEDIFQRAKAENYDAFILHLKKFEEFNDLTKKQQDVKDKIKLILENKQLEDLEDKLAVVNNNNEEIEIMNISDMDLKEKEKSLIREVQVLKENIFKLEAQLKYLDQTPDTVNELEACIEEQEQKITYYKTEKKALELAISIIEKMAENFHRTKFIPELKEQISPWLFKITKKYEEIFVDEKLQIKIRDPKLEKVTDISHLSVGAQDQICFLFKIAIAKLLTKNKEKIPVILDDIFINFDYTKRQELWKMVYSISSENQIILFTCHRHFVDEIKDFLKTQSVEIVEKVIEPFNIVII